MRTETNWTVENTVWSICHKEIACESLNPFAPNKLIFYMTLHIVSASQVAQWVKNLPAMQEKQADASLILGPQDPLEEGMATHSSVLVWRISRTEEPGGL